MKQLRTKDKMAKRNETKLPKDDCLGLQYIHVLTEVYFILSKKVYVFIQFFISIPLNVISSLHIRITGGGGRFLSFFVQLFNLIV